MEEPVAVYEEKLSQQEFLRGGCFLLRKSSRIRGVKIFSYAVIALCCLYFLSQAFVYEALPGQRPVLHIQMAYVIGLVVMILFAVFFFFFIRRVIFRTAKNAYDQKKMTTPENAKQQVVFFRDRVEIRQDGVTLVSVSYREAKGVWCDGPLRLILFSHQILGIYRADGFSQGTFEAVLQAMEIQAGRKLLK